MKSFGNITIDVYNSNEEAIAKLEAAKGTSGYDMVVPSGPYIPQMVAKGLLEALDLSRIPNLKNLQAAYTNQPFDPKNKYSVCKDFGSTGWIYDNTVIKKPITSWSDFITAAQNEGSGQTSVLDAAPDVCGIYFWANGIDWNTEDPAELDACEDVIVNQLAPHIKAFNSYPGIELAQGNYVLSQVFNGDARQGLLSVDDPSKYTWAFGAPKSEIWMDNWCILKDAKNADAAYNFINFILDPKNSATDLAFHGYDTGVTGVRDLLPSDTKFLDMVFLTPQLLTTLVPGEVNNAQDKQVEILDKAKAKAGGDVPASAGGAGRSSPSRSRRGCGTWRSSWCRWRSSSSTASATSLRSTRRAARSRPTTSRSTTTAKRSRATCWRSSRETLRISIIGTAAVPRDRLPAGLLVGGEGAVALARAAARARHRAVLDELPHPHRGVADRAERQRAAVALDADGGPARHADPLPRHARGASSSAWSTTTCH